MQQAAAKMDSLRNSPQLSTNDSLPNSVPDSLKTKVREKE
jgi:hypothetical protein